MAPTDRSATCSLRRLVFVAALLFLWLLFLAGCSYPSAASPTTAASSPTATAIDLVIEATEPAQASPVEVAVTPIPLDGPLQKNTSEISGLAWYGDVLVFLPQFPRHVSDLPGGALYALTKVEILAFLDDRSAGTLHPTPIPINSMDMEEKVAGFEGFEAIVFDGNQVYLTIEASHNRQMQSYLVRGEIAPDLSEIRLDAASMVEVPLDVQISNFSNEALLVDGERLLLFYEANGLEFNPNPVARAYTLDLQPDGTTALPHLEYRLTDATASDSEGRYWVINYFYPLDLKILPSRDPLSEQFGKGPTHVAGSVVERLVELQLPHQSGEPITFSGTPPIQLQLTPGQVARNWEGLVRLDHRGFLLATDKFPETIFAFVPYPENGSNP